MSPKRQPHRLLDGSHRVTTQTNRSLTARKQRRLRHKSRFTARMQLCGVHQKWMAKIDCTRRSRRQNLGTPLALRKMRNQLAQSQSCLTRRRQHSCDIQVRASTNTSGCIILPDVGEQEQHQQGSSFGVNVRPPIQEVRQVAVKAHVHMQPTSPGSSAEGNRTGKVPMLLQASHEPTPTN